MIYKERSGLKEKNAIDSEQSIWSLLSTGNGDDCPLYKGCDFRRSSGECFLEKNRDLVSRLYSVPCAIGNDDIGDFLAKNERKFPPNWQDDPIFNLIESLADIYIRKAKLKQPPTCAEVIEEMDVSQPIEVYFLPLKAHHGAVWHTENGWIIQIKLIIKTALPRKEKPCSTRRSIYCPTVTPRPHTAAQIARSPETVSFMK